VRRELHGPVRVSGPALLATGWRGLVVAALVAAGTQVVVQALGAAPAAASVGTNVFTATCASDSEPVKSVAVQCPVGMRVFGGGARIFNGAGRVALATMIPSHSASGDAYLVAATERPGTYNEDWSVQGYAVCGPALPGMEIVVSFTTGVKKEAFASCRDDKVVVGTGAAIGGTKAAYLTSIYNGVFVSHAQVRRVKQAPSDFWYLIVSAICAT
jgi:hypothetical protein